METEGERGEGGEDVEKEDWERVEENAEEKSWGSRGRS